jgi:hypothetical protein
LVAPNQGVGGIAMAFGLKNMLLFNLAKLTDCTIHWANKGSSLLMGVHPL